PRGSRPLRIQQSHHQARNVSQRILNDRLLQIIEPCLFGLVDIGVDTKDKIQNITDLLHSIANVMPKSGKETDCQGIDISMQFCYLTVSIKSFRDFRYSK